MKYCPNCGAQNPDEAGSCLCGYSFGVVKRKKVKSEVSRLQSGFLLPFVLAVVGFLGAIGGFFMIIESLYMEGKILFSVAMLIGGFLIAFTSIFVTYYILWEFVAKAIYSQLGIIPKKIVKKIDDEYEGSFWSDNRRKLIGVGIAALVTVILPFLA